MRRLDLRRVALLASVFCIAITIAASAQTFTPLMNFDDTSGASPFHVSLVQGLNGNLYGTTSGGGANACAFGPHCGTVFEITTKGLLTGLLSFDGTNGEFPYAGLIQTSNGILYGTTSAGASTGGGTVFQLTSAGTLSSLYSFCSAANCADGLSPKSPLVQATDGSFYGTTDDGGANALGTVFKITSGGVLTTLHSFGGSDGSYPSFAGLVQATDNNFYGTTRSGGVNGSGTVFKMNATGTLTTLHGFNNTDGYFPNGLLQATDGNFYGTTLLGGAAGVGSIFKITSAGTLTTLYSFCVQGNPCLDGDGPGDGLVQATDGNFYGTTSTGGANGSGTIYSISPGGTFTTLYSFEGNVRPYTVLLQATDGNFYGTTALGGLLTCGSIGNGCGTVFSLSVGLAPFVKTNPGFGKVGWTVIVLGTDLRGATGVTFNGTPATKFTIVSPTQIKVTVPTGATTGAVQVTTTSGTLSGNVAFRVLR